MSLEVHLPGRPTRFVPSSGFLNLLTASSLQNLPAAKAGATHGVHPSESFPPCGAVRLSAPFPFLLFMTSRSAALRTRRSRCPAASRFCSPRGSVPLDGRSRVGPILSWVSISSPEPFPFRRGSGFPVPSLLRFSCPLYGRGGIRRSRALSDGRFAAGLAARDNSLEVLHQNPVLGFSREPWLPTDESVRTGASLRHRTDPVPKNQLGRTTRRRHPHPLRRAGPTVLHP